jgi:Flp pilus assembly protein TadD
MPEEPCQRPAKHLTLQAAAALLLLVLTAAAFAPALLNGFVPYDDPDYVTQNSQVLQGITPKTIQWAFFASHAANWHPLTWLAHMSGVELFGLNPWGHHLLSVLLHAGNALLVFFLMRGLAGGLASAITVAFLFALHPLRVESVAWISELKDLLCAFFFLAALLAWRLYVRRSGLPAYLLTAALFSMSLMSKAMSVTFPCVLLLLDAWPYNRAREGRGRGALVAEKLPFFALSALCAAIVYLAQDKDGAVRAFETYAFSERLANAAAAYALYISKTVWPAGLGVFYPHPETVPALEWVPALLVLAAVTWAAVLQRKKRPFILVGWLWFLGALTPAIGIVQVGSQRMADRYTYLPCLGLLLALAPLLEEFFRKTRATRALGGVLAVCVCAALVTATRAQCATWKDGTTLFERAAAVVDNKAHAYESLGTLAVDMGEPQKGLEYFLKALPFQPDNPGAYVNIGIAWTRLGQADKARAEYVKALQIEPGHPGAHANLGVMEMALGNINAALSHLELAVRGGPKNAEYHNNLAVVLHAAGRGREAEARLKTALALRPDYPEAWKNLRKIQEGTGNTPR